MLVKGTPVGTMMNILGYHIWTKHLTPENMMQFISFWQTVALYFADNDIQYIPRNMHTVFALLCFVVVIHWLIFPYPSGLLHWHCGNLTIAPVPAKQPRWIWMNTSYEFIMNDCITTTKQSTTKPCAYFLGYTVPWPCLLRVQCSRYFIQYSDASIWKCLWCHAYQLSPLICSVHPHLIFQHQLQGCCMFVILQS